MQATDSDARQLDQEANAVHFGTQSAFLERSADVTVHADGQDFLAHAVILARQSSVFDSLLTGHDEQPAPDPTAHADRSEKRFRLPLHCTRAEAELMLAFVYSNSQASFAQSLACEEVQKLLRLAAQYGISTALAEADDHLSGQYRKGNLIVNLDSAMEYAQQADSLDLHLLSACCRDYISANSGHLSSMASFPGTLSGKFVSLLHQDAIQQHADMQANIADTKSALACQCQDLL